MSKPGAHGAAEGDSRGPDSIAQAAASPHEARKAEVQTIAARHLETDLPTKDDFTLYVTSEREAAKTSLDTGDFSAALESLEVARDARMQIHRTKSPEGVVIRDARSASGTEKELGPEGFEMQYLNTVRAAMDVAKNEGKPEFTAQFSQMAKDFMAREDTALDKKSHTKNINKLAAVLAEAGIKDPHKKLDTAKDYQNFKDTHRDVVTITRTQGKSKEGKSVNIDVVEAEVGYRKLTDTQRAEYEKIQAYTGKLPIKKTGILAKIGGKKTEAPDLPKWFIKLKPDEQKLCKESTPKILDGSHTIPTQLLKIAGLRNAFEKTTSVKIEGGSLEEVHSVMHSGTVASLCKDKKVATAVGKENVRQAKEWAGGEKLHVNVLNSKNNIFTDDGKIATRAIDAAKGTGEQATATPFNAFRKFGGYDTKDLEKSAAGADPITEALATNKRSGENRSLKISTALGRAAHAAKGTFGKVLVMCKSGKDRTGLAMHMQTEEAVKVHLDSKGVQVEDKELHTAILRGGHTANQAGSISAGGATIGAFGTKSENKAGIPKSRKEELQAIMEPTANTNKVKSPGKFSKLKATLKATLGLGKKSSPVEALKAQQGKPITLYTGAAGAPPRHKGRDGGMGI